MRRSDPGSLCPRGRRIGTSLSTLARGTPRFGRQGSTMTHIFNRRSEKGTRQSLRNSLPPVELILWSKLKNRQICAQKFRRQFSVGPYVVDFYCPALKLAIEIDGDSHFQPGEQEKDSTRQRFIE